MPRKAFEDFDIVSTSDDKIEYYSTGCLSLDMAIGIGGIPRGRFTEIFGEESTGKSTLSLQIANTVINSGGKVAYIDTENQMVYDYAKSIIKNLNDKNFILSKPYTAEKSFEIMEYYINTDKHDLIILDSVAALSPMEELKKDFDESSMTLTSRLLSKFFRRQAFNVRENKIAVIFTNQVRDTIGSYFKTFSTPGGHSLKHYTSLRISLTKGKKIKQGDTQIGNYVNVSIVKNKVAPPFKSTSIPLIYGVGFDELLDIISTAEMFGILTRAGSYYRYENNNIGQGILDTKEFLKNNPEVLDKISKECYNMRDNMKGGMEFIENDY